MVLKTLAFRGGNVVQPGPLAPVRRMKPLLVIADPHASTREMLTVALGGAEGVAEVVGSVGGLVEAARVAVEKAAEVVLMSLGLPDGSGATAVHRLREAAPAARVLVHTGTEDRALLLATLAAGPAGRSGRRSRCSSACGPRGWRRCVRRWPR